MSAVPASENILVGVASLSLTFESYHTGHCQLLRERIISKKGCSWTGVRTHNPSIAVNELDYYKFGNYRE